MVGRKYSAADLHELNKDLLPRHIAIIMDGNRRWAKKKLLPMGVGHKKGADNLIEIVKAAMELGLQALTAYTFSTENWRRPPNEIQLLLEVLEKYLISKRKEMIKEGIRFNTIGDLKRFPSRIVSLIEETKMATKEGAHFDLILALNYGGRDEIVRATQKIVKDVQKNSIDGNTITEELFSSYLDTAPWGDPEIVLRTSGESRISNFLLWQISYSELITVNTLWPDFTHRHLLESIILYQKCERRMGV